MNRKTFGGIMAVVVFMACAVLLSGISGTKADAATYGDLTYTVSNGEVTITDCSTSATSVIIPDMIDGCPVTGIGVFAFSGCSSLVSVNIPPSITSIGDYAFSNATSLTRVDITDIAAWCNISFNGSSNSNPLYYAKNLYCRGSLLTDLTIPDGVTSIKKHAFYNCTSLVSVKIPSSVTSIGNFAFNGNTSLASIDIPGSVSSIGEYAFSGCSSLADITLPAGVTYIGSSAFSLCSDLEHINIPDGVTCIKAYTFYKCMSLGHVSVPNSVTSVESYAFSCSGIESILLPSGVTSIGDNAFSGCASLRDISLPSDIQSIGYDAFSDAENLKYNTYSYAEYLGNENNPYVYLAGVESTDITSCNIHPDTKIIGNSSFRSCKSIESITVPDGVRSIEDYAFYNCTSLKNISICPSITSIGQYAFVSCKSLKEIRIPDGVASVEDFTFYNCSALTSIELPDGVSKIGEYAFYNCKALSAINLPSELTSVGTRAFYGCASLSSGIVIPEGVIIIGEYAFSGCKSLESISIPSSVTDICHYAFSDCTALTSIYYNAARALDLSMDNHIFNNAGKNCGGIKLTIGKSVEHIPANMFAPYRSNSLYSPNITEIVFEQGGVCTSIGNYAFCYCASVTSISLTPNVTSIGKYAFYECKNLATVYYCGTEQEWNGISIETNNIELTDADRLYHKLDGLTVTQPTCDADGSETGKCADCEETITVILPALGHKWSDWSVVKEPTATEDGYRIRTCSRCNNTEEDVILFASGDIDGDGSMTNTDVTYALRAMTGWDVSGELMRMDTNYDGRITNRDIITVIRRLSDDSSITVTDPSKVQSRTYSLVKYADPSSADEVACIDLHFDQRCITARGYLTCEIVYGDDECPSEEHYDYNGQSYHPVKGGGADWAEYKTADGCIIITIDGAALKLELLSDDTLRAVSAFERYDISAGDIFA